MRVTNYHTSVENRSHRARHPPAAPTVPPAEREVVTLYRSGHWSREMTSSDRA